MRTPYSPTRARNILCVFPRYTPSFGTFHHAYSLPGGVRASVPPQRLLPIAAYLPKSWRVRFVDENARAETPEDFRWADSTIVSHHLIEFARRCVAGMPGPLFSAPARSLPSVLHANT